MRKVPIHEQQTSFPFEYFMEEKRLADSPSNKDTLATHYRPTLSQKIRSTPLASDHIKEIFSTDLSIEALWLPFVWPQHCLISLLERFTNTHENAFIYTSLSF
jgi:hypothetical protein